MKNLKFACSICFYFIFVAGCSSPTATPTMTQQDIYFQTAVPIRNSPEIHLFTREESQLRIHYTLDLYVENMSDNCVIFPFDFGLSIWYFKDGQWNSIKDLAVVINPQDLILQPKGQPFSEQPVTIFPDYDVLAAEQPSSLRVFISGRLCKDGNPTDQIVGNYIDVKVVP